MYDDRNHTQLLAVGHYGKGRTEIPPYIDPSIGSNIRIPWQYLYPQLGINPLVKLTPAEQKKHSKTIMRAFVATRKQK